MQYNDKVFMSQFPIVKRFIYHLVYYREIYKVYNKHKLQCEFWTHTIDAHLLQAAILWCMVFGSDGCNPTHWKNLSKSNYDELKTSFRNGLPANTGLTLHEYHQYWEKMIEFRNKYAAHRELNFNKPIPNFDVALKIAYYYDNWIRGVISPDIFDEPPLQESASKLKLRVEPLFDVLLGHAKESQQN
ncbi:MAG: hypothetical protein FJ134_09655 [Deltaproteobacteria bacterium]|nr:hypothetical protein [Deltaproteobacteria bacterium]